MSLQRKCFCVTDEEEIEKKEKQEKENAEEQDFFSWEQMKWGNLVWISNFTSYNIPAAFGK